MRNYDIGRPPEGHRYCDLRIVISDERFQRPEISEEISDK
jgi:hypothetical protein